MLMRITAITLALAVSACASDTDTEMDDTAMGMAADTGIRESTAAGAVDVGSWSSANVIAHISTGDSLEVELARMAQQRATNDEVRSIAQTLEQDHSANRDRATQLAEQEGVTMMPPPGDTSATHFRNVTQRLEQLQDQEFDRAFVQQQIEHHDEEVRKLTTMQSTVQDPEVREFVESTLNAVQQHLQRLQQISTSLTNTQ